MSKNNFFQKTLLTLTAFILVQGVYMAQEFRVERVTGTVKAQAGLSEEFVPVTEGMVLKKNTLLMTDKNATLSLSGEGVRFTLKPQAAVNLNDLRRMTVEELLMALALEEILDAGTKGEKSNLKNTAIYGSGTESKTNGGNFDFGVMKLNGAMQLAEGGFTETAIITAKDVFRRYPTTAGMAEYRIFFAKQLMKHKLWREALDEFNAILKLNIGFMEKQSVNESIEFIKQQTATKK